MDISVTENTTTVDKKTPQLSDVASESDVESIDSPYTEKQTLQRLKEAQLLWNTLTKQIESVINEIGGEGGVDTRTNYKKQLDRLEKDRAVVEKRLNNLRVKLNEFSRRGLPPQVLQRLESVLPKCDSFNSNEMLRATFADKRIWMWRDELPQVDTTQERVRIIVNLLHSRYDDDNENALIQFLRVLRDHVHLKDSLYGELTALIDNLSSLVMISVDSVADNLESYSEVQPDNAIIAGNGKDTSETSSSAEKPRKSVFQKIIDFFLQAQRVTDLLYNVKKSVERLSQARATDVKEVAAAQIELLSSYYALGFDQASRSFLWAIIAAFVGLAFFVTAIAFLLIQQSQDLAVVSLISGALVEVISGVNFYLYNKSSAQLAEFHTRLESTQRYLLADSMCEGLEGDFKQKARADIVRAIVRVTVTPDPESGKTTELTSDVAA